MFQDLFKEFNIILFDAFNNLCGKEEKSKFNKMTAIIITQGTNILLAVYEELRANRNPRGDSTHSC